MNRNYGPWKIIDSHHVYSDSYLQVRLDDVIRPDSKDGNHVVVHMKPGVCVLPLDHNGVCHLTKEFHYAIGRESIEAVSGGIEPNETGRTTAERELQEELGLAAQQWELLTTLDPYTTIICSPVELYLARELTQVDSSPEGTERIEAVSLPLKLALEYVYEGKITHGPTCVLLLLAQTRLTRNHG